MSGALAYIRSWLPATPQAVVEQRPGDPAPVEGDPKREYGFVQGDAFLRDFSPGLLGGMNCGPQPASILRQVAKIPAVQSSLFTLKSAALSSDFGWMPRYTGDKVDPAKVEEAARAVEECERAEAALRSPLSVVAWELMDGLVERYALAETVMKADPLAPGLLTLDAIRPKPQWCYRFRVDGPMRVVGIDVWDGETWITLDPCKFTWLTWQSKGGDPQGESILDGAMPYVNMLLQAWPEFFTWITQFGRPRTVVAEGPNAAKQVSVLGKLIDGVKHLAATIAATKGGGTAGVPHGTDVKILESLRDGKGLIEAIKLLEGQAIKSIILVVNATVEAQHGTRADSGTKRDVLNTFVKVVQVLVCACLSRPFYEVLKANHGEAYACEYMPYLGLGQVDPDTLAQLAEAFAALYAAGYPTEAQLAFMDGIMGVPPRRAGDQRVGGQQQADPNNQATSAASPDGPATTNPAPAGGADRP